MRKEPRKLFFKHIVRKLFLEDWAMKLIALVITLALWLGVTGLSTPTVKRMTVPLNLSVSNNTEIINVPKQEVDIEISGDKRKIDQINKSELAASLDLTDIAPGDRLISLTPENVSVPLPQGVTLVEVSPLNILIKLEAVEEKDVEVRTQTEGDPSAGFEIYGVSVLPQTIRVRGPASFIKTLDFVFTDKIDISERKEGFMARQVPVSVSNPKATVLNTVVDVFFRISEKRVEKTFVVPVTGQTGGKKAVVVLYIPRTLVARVRPEELRVEIVRSETGEDMPQLLLPPEYKDVVEIRKLRLKT